MGFLGFLGGPLGWVMDLIYQLVNSYGWAIILFTILVRLVMLPFSIKQQKSTARMQAYQPMINEINKKWANDKQRQSEEMMKLQEEYGFSPMAGCMPMLLTFLVLFGIIDVVYKPLQHILRISSTTISAAAEALGIASNYMTENTLIARIQADPSVAEGLFSAEQIQQISSFNMNFLGIDLGRTPVLSLAPETLPLLIFPVLSVLTMFLSNIIMTRMSGQEMQGTMKWMPWIMSLMFVTYSFQVPVAFSLYYTISNLVMCLQSVFLKLVYDPVKMKQQVLAEIEEKKQAKKRKKQVTVTDEATGETVTKEVSEAEMIKIRLARARALDQEKYKDERTTPLAAPADGEEN